MIPIAHLRRRRRAEPAAPGTRLRYLMNDFTVQEHVCNLRCSDCLNFENELKGGKPWVPVEKVDLAQGGAGLERARAVLASCEERADAPILRFSGGEILAIGGALNLIVEATGRWDRVQVLTNATLLSGEMRRPHQRRPQPRSPPAARRPTRVMGLRRRLPDSRSR